MVQITKDNTACVHNASGRCVNSKVANSPVVDESLQSRWYCSNCPYYENIHD